MRTLLFFFIITLTFSSCYEDIDNSETLEVIEEQPKTDGETGLSGHISNGTPILESDYELVINGKTTSVPNAHFYFESTRLQKQGQLIEAFKDGELIAMAYPFLIENDINEVEMSLLPPFQQNAFSGTLMLDNNITINIDNEAIRNASGDIADKPEAKTIISVSYTHLTLPTTPYV